MDTGKGIKAMPIKNLENLLSKVRHKSFHLPSLDLIKHSIKSYG